MSKCGFGFSLIVFFMIIDFSFRYIKSKIVN